MYVFTVHALKNCLVELCTMAANAGVSENRIYIAKQKLKEPSLDPFRILM